MKSWFHYIITYKIHKKMCFLCCSLGGAKKKKNTTEEGGVECLKTGVK